MKQKKEKKRMQSNHMEASHIPEVVLYKVHLGTYCKMAEDDLKESGYTGIGLGPL